MTTNVASAFRERARHEAARYGTDPWVFVRELLQNSRDAGARRVEFKTSRLDGRECINCRDDGSGMSFDHAQRYLFSLYSSSKRGHPRTAGRFGIGFWSVLRFNPEEIVVRSKPNRGGAWQVRLDGRLEGARRERATMERGTEVVLHRPASTNDLERCLTAAILRDAPFVNCRRRADRPLEVLVNGRPVRAEPTLPPPSLSFRRRGLRGVVGLGPEPRAEVFAHGLRVRDATTLDELLVEVGPRRRSLSAMTEGLAPRIIIDSSDLEVLMARGDAREDRALKRLVVVGHRELSRLVRAELDRHIRLSALARFVERLREAWSAKRPLRVATAMVLVAAMAVLVVRGSSSLLPGRTFGPMTAEPESLNRPPPSLSFRDLWGRYRGPDIDSVGGSVASVDLSYRPSPGVHFFAALWITGLTDDGRLEASDQRVVGRYIGSSCFDACLEVELGVDSPAGLLRLPIATGHLIDPESVYLDGFRQPVVAVATGQPAVKLDKDWQGRLRYRSGPGDTGEFSETAVWPPLPPDLADFARGLDGMQPSLRALEAAAYVRGRVTYDTSAETVARHRQARRKSIGFFDRAAIIGAGDCDIQNSLVAAMLDESGVSSRLAVGWVGADGRARTGLHAWAEYRGADGRWRAIDASAGGAAIRPDAAAIPFSEARQDRSPIRIPVWIPAILSVALVSAALAFYFSRRLWRRKFRAGDADDVVGLLRSAAVRPQAFEQIYSLSSRRLLGLLSGRSISLARARKAASLGHLACGSRRSQLARQAARGGGLVLNNDRAESAAVADVLAAVDLDRWQELLDRVVSNDLTTRVESVLGAHGEIGRFVVANNPGFELAVLDGDSFGLGPGVRWTVADENGALWQLARLLATRWPDRAALLLVDAVIHRTGAPSAVRQRCLSMLAHEALHEASGEAV